MKWIGKGDGSARALARCLIIDGVICLKTDRQSQQQAAWDWILIVMTSAESRPRESVSVKANWPLARSLGGRLTG